MDGMEDEGCRAAVALCSPRGFTSHAAGARPTMATSVGDSTPRHTENRGGGHLPRHLRRLHLLHLLVDAVAIGQGLHSPCPNPPTCPGPAGCGRREPKAALLDNSPTSQSMIDDPSARLGEGPSPCRDGMPNLARRAGRSPGRETRATNSPLGPSQLTTRPLCLANTAALMQSARTAGELDHITAHWNPLALHRTTDCSNHTTGSPVTPVLYFQNPAAFAGPESAGCVLQLASHFGPWATPSGAVEGCVLSLLQICLVLGRNGKQRRRGRPLEDFYVPHGRLDYDSQQEADRKDYLDRQECQPSPLNVDIALRREDGPARRG